MDHRQRRALNGLAGIAAGLGLGALVFAGAGTRVLGMPAGRRSLWGIRLFGVRELCLAYGLARAARSGDRGQGRLMADLVTAAQAGDSLLAAALLARGELSWRVALVIWSGVPPTLVGTRKARGPDPDRKLRVDSGFHRARSPLIVRTTFPVFCSVSTYRTASTTSSNG